MMTQIETNFLNSAISFFRKNNASKFVELTALVANEPKKMTVNIDLVKAITACDRGAIIFFTHDDGGVCVTESYDDVKSLLKL